MFDVILISQGKNPFLAVLQKSEYFQAELSKENQSKFSLPCSINPKNIAQCTITLCVPRVFEPENFGTLFLISQKASALPITKLGDPVKNEEGENKNSNS